VGRERRRDVVGSVGWVTATLRSCSDRGRLVMTRLITGHLDAVVEVGSRMIHEIPGLRAEYERVGGVTCSTASPVCGDDRAVIVWGP
jgi:hypothetical protein